MGNTTTGSRGNGTFGAGPRFVGSLIFSAAMAWVALPAPLRAQPEAEKDPKPPEIVTRVYDVRDLLQERRDYPLESDVLPVTQVFGYSPQRGRQRSNTNVNPNRRSSSTGDEMIESLTRLIEETIDPNNWRDQGGTYGAIRVFNAQLVVSQTAENHAALQKLLEQLREQAMRMVTVRAHWVLLAPGEVDAVTQPFKPLRPAPRRPATQPGEKPDDAPPADADPALLVADMAAIDKLADKVTRYRAQTTCFSGQLVHVASGRARTVIADQTPVVGAGIMGYESSVSLVQDGASLEVSSLLAPDGRSAVVEITSVVSEWAGDPQKSKPMPVAATQPVTGDSPATIDRLNVLVQQMRTTVALPIGKPILVGGMTLSAPRGDPKPADDRQMYLIVEVLAAKGAR